MFLFHWYCSLINIVKLYTFTTLSSHTFGFLSSDAFLFIIFAYWKTCCKSTLTVFYFNCKYHNSQQKFRCKNLLTWLYSHTNFWSAAAAALFLWITNVYCVSQYWWRQSRRKWAHTWLNAKRSEDRGKGPLWLIDNGEGRVIFVSGTGLCCK